MEYKGVPFPSLFILLVSISDAEDQETPLEFDVDATFEKVAEIADSVTGIIEKAKTAFTPIVAAPPAY